ncbi:MAG: gluconate 2-dehydrogenase subunit 3 family protein [Aggregatilineales bacterium]
MPPSAAPAQTASTFRALVNVLLPGDDLFPPAGEVGVHLWLMDKLRSHFDEAEDVFTRIAQALNRGHARPFADLDASAQASAVAQFERELPDLFAFVRAAVYFGYYQTPPVIEAVRALGRDYNAAPQPQGYTLAPFDPATLPAQPRGRYVRTEDVRPVETENLEMHGLRPIWK